MTRPDRQKLPPHPLDRVGDILINFGVAIGFIGGTLRLIFLIVLGLGAAASIDERSGPGTIVLLVLFYVWHRFQISKLTKSPNKSPPPGASRA